MEKKFPLRVITILLALYFLTNISGRIIQDIGFDFEIRYTTYFISVLPTILFAICIYLKKSKQSNLILLLAYAVLGLQNIIYLIGRIVLIAENYKNTVDINYSHYTNIIFYILTLFMVLLCVITIINKYKWLKITRIFLLIHAGINIVYAGINIIQSMRIIAQTRFVSYALGNIVLGISIIILQSIYLVFWFSLVEREKVLLLENELVELKNLLDTNIITEEEYHQRKKEILNRV